MNKLPMQPIVWDDHGVIRFKENRIVRWLLDAGPFDMNQIAALPGITDDERTQFAQLIGYSVSGAGDLPYFDDEVLEQADAMAEELSKEKK
jgi:hypothetical protein